jgi:hypothetical protein
MSETANISRMAEILADDIFLELKWRKEGPPNINYPCKSPAHGKKTHPADVVFSYKDPYDEIRHFILIDLKSYTDSSITPLRVNEALVSLGKAVDCTETNEAWKKLFYSGSENFDVTGLLFVFNHDGTFDSSFSDVLKKVAKDQPSIPSDVRVHVLGPEDVWYLNNIVTDMHVLRSKGRLPQVSECGFYYPDLSRTRVVMDEWASAATIECLKGPWQIIKYKDSVNGGVSLLVYYRGAGTNADEFIYLIDMLVHYQLVSNMTSIQVRAPFADKDAPGIFENAVMKYIEPLRERGVSNVAKVEKLKLEMVQKVTPNFSEIEIGLNQR